MLLLLLQVLVIVLEVHAVVVIIQTLDLMAATVEIAGVGTLGAFRLLLLFLFKLFLLDGHDIETSCLDHTIRFRPSFSLDLLLDIRFLLVTAVLIQLLHPLFYFDVLNGVDVVL